MAYYLCPNGCRVELGEAPEWAVTAIIQDHDADCNTAETANRGPS